MSRINSAKSRLTAIIICLAIAGWIAGCLKPTGGNVAVDRGKNELIVGTTMKIDGINIADYNFGILRNIFTHMGLVKLTENGDFSGELAENWDNADGKIWTFKLRDGVVWHDGQKVTAADVKFTLEYLAEKVIEYKSHLASIKTVDTPDDRTVVITLSRPNPRFLVNLLVVRILPQHIFAGVDNPALFNEPTAAIGCGPYIFRQFDAAAGLLVFEANEKYYRGAPLVPRVKVRLFRNPDTLYMALQNGEIDLPYFYSAGTEPLYAANLARNNSLKMINTTNLGVSKALFFNVSKAPVNDPAVRNALSYAIDYQELLRLFTSGNGEVPLAGFVPRGTPRFIETRRLEYAPEKAQKILDDAGYLPGPDGVRIKNGQALSLEIMVRSDIAENIRLAELLQKYFAAIGVKISLKTVDSTLFRTISDKDKSYTSLLTRATPWGMMMSAGMGTGYFDSRNIGWSMVADRKFRDIVDKMGTALQGEEYRKTGAELQGYYEENLPAIPLYWDSFVQPYNAAWSGFQVSPLYGVLNEETWFRLHKTD